MSAQFFSTPTEFYEWLLQFHEQEDELWVGYYKKHTKIPSMTWPESVDQALCFGWIDGLRHRIDDQSYKIRFTPRRKNSNWSAVNIERFAVLHAEGLVHEAGLAAYRRRQEDKSRIYTYENKDKISELPPDYLAQLQAHPLAWEYYDQHLAPSYKRISIYWILQAKREATRQRRLSILIESCAAGQKIPLLRPKK